MSTDRHAANLAYGLLSVLSTADLLDAVARSLTELDRRGADITFTFGGIETQWASISEYEDEGFKAVYYAEGGIDDAEASVSRVAQLDKAKVLADQLLVKERNKAGSGSSGHLSEADLTPLLQVLDA